MIIEKNDEVLFTMRSDGWDGTTDIAVNEVEEGSSMLSLGSLKWQVGVLCQDT
jgi:hypothetical protein